MQVSILGNTIIPRLQQQCKLQNQLFSHFLDKFQSKQSFIFMAWFVYDPIITEGEM